jgi:hypothetical protein
LRYLFLFSLFLSASPANAGVYDLNKTFLPEDLSIKFCWWGGSYGTKSELKKKIENHVTENISFVSHIQVNRDWPACESQPEEEIRKYVSLLPFDEVEANPQARTEILEKYGFYEYYTFHHPKTPGHPRAESYGRHQFHNSFDVVLSFHFQKVKPGLVEQAAGLSPQGKENLILSIALHEVLHVFGAVHEHFHFDSDCVQKGEEPFLRRKGEDYYRTTYISPRFDPGSIMNYCLTRTHDYDQGPLEMSSGDREALHEVYSRSGE